MGMSREAKIKLAYTRFKANVSKEGLDRPHARALLFVAEKFNISPLTVDSIVKRTK